MPFHNVASKLVLLVVSLLVHNALIARCAPPGPVSSATSAAADLAVSATANSSGSDLLDAHKMPLLTVCDKDIPGAKLCDLYRSLVKTEFTQRRSGPVTVDELEKVIAEKADPDRFCNDFVPVVKNRKAKHPEIVTGSVPEDGAACNVWCMEMNEDKTVTLGVKSVCKVLLWGYRQEMVQEVVPQDAIQKVVSENVVPPLLAQNAQLPNVDKKEAIETKPGALPVATQPNITEPGKAAVQPPSAPKVSAADNKQKSLPDTATAAAGQPASDVAAAGVEAQVTPSKAVSTVSDTQQKPEQAEKDITEGESFQEQQNENNLNAANNDGETGNLLDDGENMDEEDDYNMDQPADATLKNLKDDAQLPAQGLPHDANSDGLGVDQPAAAEVKIEKVDPFFDPDDSNFFSYFIFMMFACIVCYVAYHNKSKLLALVIEGRRSNSGRGGFSKGGRKHTAAYRKLDCNLEEAITSNASSNSRSTSQFIY